MKGMIKHKYTILALVICFILICVGIILASDKYRIQYVSSDSEMPRQLEISTPCRYNIYDKVLEGVTISTDSDGIMITCDTGYKRIHTLRYTNDGKLKQEILWN